MKCLFLLLVFLACNASEGAKILAVFPMSAHSHFTIGFSLMKELAERGHEVTMINPYPQKTPIKNYRDIDISSTIASFGERFKIQLERINDMSSMESIPFFYSMGYYLSDETFKHKNVQNLLNSGEKFDLVIMEQFFNEAMLYFAHHFKAPLLVMSSLGASIFTNNYFKNPAPYSYVPYLFSSAGSEMTFLERANNIYLNVFDEFLRHFIAYPKQNEILHKYFPDAPSLDKLMKQVHVILLNSHASVNEPLPLVPNLIEIGGYHVKPTGKLPKDIQEYLDKATDGVVYFCLGSNLKPSEMTQDKKDIFLNSLGKLKHKVLWKFEADSISGKPDNVKLVKWAPQQDILAHPNVKVFVTHGGMLGTIEAVYFGVPTVGIPFYGDQVMNMKTSVKKGYSIMVPLEELSEEKLTSALQESLSNPKYAKKAKELSAVMHDRIVKPMDEAVYWVEYMIRHPNADHFKSVGMELNFFQYYLLDILSAAIAIVAIILLVLRKIICMLRRKTSKNSQNQKKKKN